MRFTDFLGRVFKVRSGTYDVTRLIFRLRYFPTLEEVRSDPQSFRIEYLGQHYEMTDYDDYNERRRVIKLTGEHYELPVTVEVLVPTTANILGVLRKAYPERGFEADCEWVNLGTDEKSVNGVVSVTERVKMTVRSRSGITSACRIRRADGSLWDIVGAPDNTALADRWQVFTVQRVKGGA